MQQQVDDAEKLTLQQRPQHRREKAAEAVLEQKVGDKGAPANEAADACDGHGHALGYWHDPEPRGRHRRIAPRW